MAVISGVIQEVEKSAGRQRQVLQVQHWWRMMDSRDQCVSSEISCGLSKVHGFNWRWTASYFDFLYSHS